MGDVTISTIEDFREYQVRVGDTKTRYIEAGNEEAPTLLLLHDGAWGGASDVTWARCIPHLAPDYRVLAPDFLGYGGSDKVTFFDRSSYAPRIDQLTGFLAALDISAPVHIVGSSFGGSVALRLVASARFPIASATSIGGSGGLWKTETMGSELGRWDGTRDDLARVLEHLMDRGSGFAAQLDARERWAREPGHYRALASAGMPIPAALRRAVPDRWPEELRPAWSTVSRTSWS